MGIRLQRRQQILSRYLTAVMNGLNMFELTWVRIQATENRKIKEENHILKTNLHFLSNNFSYCIFLLAFNEKNNSLKNS